MKTPLRSFKDLNVWKESHILVLDIYRVTKTFPKEELFGLTSQLRRAAVSITSNIAEGFNRSSQKEKVQFYSMALGSLAEVQNQLEVAHDIGYVEEETFLRLATRETAIHKMLNSLMRSIRNSSS